MLILIQALGFRRSGAVDVSNHFGTVEGDCLTVVDGDNTYLISVAELQGK